MLFPVAYHFQFKLYLSSSVLRAFQFQKCTTYAKYIQCIENDWRYLDLHLYKVFQNLQHEQIVCAHQRSEWGMMMGNCPPDHPWEENHLWTANRTSMWNIPSSVSSSGNMADPSDLEARSIWPRLTLCSDPDGGLFMAPSRFSGVLSSVESKQRRNMMLEKSLQPINDWKILTKLIKKYPHNIFHLLILTFSVSYLLHSQKTHS